MFQTLICDQYLFIYFFIYYYYYYYLFITTATSIPAESVKWWVSEVRYKGTDVGVGTLVNGRITDDHALSTARLRLRDGFPRNDVIRGEIPWYDVIRRGLLRDDVDCWRRIRHDADETRHHVDGEHWRATVKCIAIIIKSQ